VLSNLPNVTDTMYIMDICGLVLLCCSLLAIYKHRLSLSYWL